MAVSEWQASKHGVSAWQHGTSRQPRRQPSQVAGKAGRLRTQAGRHGRPHTPGSPKGTMPLKPPMLGFSFWMRLTSSLPASMSTPASLYDSPSEGGAAAATAGGRRPPRRSWRLAGAGAARAAGTVPVRGVATHTGCAAPAGSPNRCTMTGVAASQQGDAGGLWGVLLAMRRAAWQGLRRARFRCRQRPGHARWFAARLRWAGALRQRPGASLDTTVSQPAGPCFVLHDRLASPPAPAPATQPARPTIAGEAPGDVLGDAAKLS